MTVLGKYLLSSIPREVEGEGAGGGGGSEGGTALAVEGGSAPPAVAEGTAPGAEATEGGQSGQEKEQVESPRIPKERFDQVVRQRWEAHSKADMAEGRAKVLESSLSELQRRIASLPAEVAQQYGLASQVPSPPGAAPGQSQQYYTREQVEQLAAQQAEIAQFNRDCDKVAREGQKKFKDFDDKLTELRKMCPFDPAVGGPTIPQTLVQAALVLDEPETALYELGKDSVEAERIIALPPVQQAAALAKFASRVAAKGKASPPAVSKAPPPIANTVGGGARSAEVDLYDKQTDIATWMAERKKQVEANRGRR